MAHRSPIHDTLVFLLEVFSRPRMVGAIAPSSRQLARSMAGWVPQNFSGFVLELGPGTGSVTRALLERGLAPERLVAVEKSPKLAEHLQERFPGVKVVMGDAMELENLMKQHARQAIGFRHVISSLPLRNFPLEVAERIAAGIHSLMAPNAKLVQFSYHLGPGNNKALARFRPVKSHVVWWNVPPARVSVYEK
jgi:phosphatidylethanolamine/phosphatidyl-N-methylethanolamine N-methyltransferase